MADEIRTEEIEVTDTVETEDVKESLGPMEYGVILGIATAGIAVFEGGKWVWKKTEGPRSKIKEKAKGIFGKKDKPAEKDNPDQEVSAEKVAETPEEKKTETKKGSKK